MKKILITGGTGFIGKNLTDRYKNSYEFISYTRQTSDDMLHRYIDQADAVIHLAGVSRSQDPKEFYEGNSDLAKKITDTLVQQKKVIPLMFTSSIHAEMDNDFGKSKRMAEDSVLSYGSTGAPIYILRLTNTFGKWAKPNAHSVVATFCYNISHAHDIQISDPAKEMNLAYVDDVVDSIVNLIEGLPTPYLDESKPHYYEIIKTYRRTLGDIAKTIYACKEGKIDAGDEFAIRMNTTYQSYLATK